MLYEWYLWYGFDVCETCCLCGICSMTVMCCLYGICGVAVVFVVSVHAHMTLESGSQSGCFVPQGTLGKWQCLYMGWSGGL